LFIYENHAGEIFEVYLVDDACVWRNDGQISESGLAPAEECIAFFVAKKLKLSIQLESLRGAEFRRLERSGQLPARDRLQRIDAGRVAA